MTSKTFKSVNADAKKDLLVVLEVDEGVNIHIESPVDRRGVSVAPTDAPALALAVLEAAGVKDTSTGGLITHDRVAVTNLKIHIEKQEPATAEARERAALEAEAVELFNANHGTNRTDWDHADRSVISSWVRVARRARELAKEATK